MSNINTIFQDSLESAVRDHLVPNRTGKRENWHWSLKATQDCPDPVKKLRLVLSWVLGRTVLDMTPAQVLKHTIEEYKKSRYHSFLGLKYGEYHC